MKQKQPLNSLVEQIRCLNGLSESERSALLSVSGEIGKLFRNFEFKVEMLNGVKETLSLMLEETVNELESKSKKIEEANNELSKALEQLKAHASEVELQKKNVETEKARSEKLLQDILPVEIIHELKTYGKSFARRYEHVTVMFADIKDFSTIAENLLPDEVVTYLDEYFRGFDHIIEKHGMEKIKTIGDAHLCVSGLFNNEELSALSAVNAAMDMLEFANSFGASKKIQGMPVFDFRIGIHTGGVVGGVIGVKKFAFDIWGDTVNMATRMEQSGEAGKVNISASTYNEVKDKYACIERGKVSLKNGRKMEMFFVDRKLG
jgi:class 3 adenylate cyclase